MKDNKLLLIAGAAGAFLIYQNQQKKKEAEADAQRQAYLLAQTGQTRSTSQQPNVIQKAAQRATTILDTISKGKELFSSIFKKPTLPPVSTPTPSWETEGKVDYSGLLGIANKMV